MIDDNNLNPSSCGFQLQFELFFQGFQAEVAYHRQKFLAEAYIGEPLKEEYQDYLADFTAEFHSIDSQEATLYLQPEPVPLCYYASQRFAFQLLMKGSNGILYASTRNPSGTCIACFRAALVYNVRPGKRYVLHTELWRNVWKPA